MSKREISLKFDPIFLGERMIKCGFELLGGCKGEWVLLLVAVVGRDKVAKIYVLIMFLEIATFISADTDLSLTIPN